MHGREAGKLAGSSRVSLLTTCTYSKSDERAPFLECNAGGWSRSAICRTLGRRLKSAYCKQESSGVFFHTQHLIVGRCTPTKHSFRIATNRFTLRKWAGPGLFHMLVVFVWSIFGESLSFGQAARRMKAYATVQ